MYPKELKNLNDLLQYAANSKAERKTLFIGIVANTILSTQLFSKNISLKEYVQMYEKVSKKNEPFKDYLFASRTMLLSRVLRIIIEDVDNENINKVIKQHLDFMENLERKLLNSNHSNRVSKNNSDQNSSLIKEMYKNRKKKGKKAND